MHRFLKCFKTNFEEVISLIIVLALLIGLSVPAFKFINAALEQGEAVETVCSVTYATTEKLAVCAADDNEKIVIETENAADLIGARMTIKQFENGTFKIYNMFGFMVDTSNLNIFEYDLSNTLHMTEKERHVYELLTELKEVKNN